MYKEISRCRICGNADLDSILDLGVHALTGVFPYPNELVEKAPLELVKCCESGGDSCGLVQLRHSFEPALMYGQNYGYRSGLNQSMIAHLRGIAEHVKRIVALSPNDIILDIGSNDSTLLQFLYEPGVVALGIDPTGFKFRNFYPPTIQLIPEFFSSATFFKYIGHKRAKIVSSIAMFYDLENPLDFMTQVRDVLADDGIWIFEQSYLPIMLAQTSYDTICHEHLEYYRLKQIIWMAEQVGLKILDVALNEANGGSFRVVASHASAPKLPCADKIAAVLSEENNGGFAHQEVYSRFSRRVMRHRDDLRGVLARFRREGKIVLGYGASTKGNVILQFCGFGVQDLPCIAEVNVDKFGRVTPGTGIPIVSEEEAMALDPDVFVALPWHFRNNFISRSQSYLSTGRAFLFPLPVIEVYRSAQGASNWV